MKCSEGSPTNGTFHRSNQSNRTTRTKARIWSIQTRLSCWLSWCLKSSQEQEYFALLLSWTCKICAPFMPSPFYFLTFYSFFVASNTSNTSTPLQHISSARPSPRFNGVNFGRHGTEQWSSSSPAKPHDGSWKWQVHLTWLPHLMQPGYTDAAVFSLASSWSKFLALAKSTLPRMYRKIKKGLLRKCKAHRIVSWTKGWTWIYSKGLGNMRNCKRYEWISMRNWDGEPTLFHLNTGTVWHDGMCWSTWQVAGCQNRSSTRAYNQTHGASCTTSSGLSSLYSHKMSRDAFINYPGLPCPIEIIALLSTKERISLRASSCDSTSSQQSQHINHFPAAPFQLRSSRESKLQEANSPSMLRRKVPTPRPSEACSYAGEDLEELAPWTISYHQAELCWYDPIWLYEWNWMKTRIEGPDNWRPHQANK